jgi:hypothetical protein
MAGFIRKDFAELYPANGDRLTDELQYRLNGVFVLGPSNCAAPFVTILSRASADSLLCCFDFSFGAGALLQCSD